MKDLYPTRQFLFPERRSQRSEAAVSEALTLNLTGHDQEDPPPPLLASVAGLDQQPRQMSLDEIRSLGDVFTQEILLKGEYPVTLGDLVSLIENLPIGYPLRELFLVAEGGQFNVSDPAFEPNARLAFTWQANAATPPDFLISTVPNVSSDQSLLQLISWSEADGSFHFFERKGAKWAWAGNSHLALTEPSRGKGPFDSHVNGGLVMKELKFPWAHWHSMSSSIPREIFSPDSEFNTHGLFANLSNAERLENIVKSGIRRWTKSRIERDTQGGRLENVSTYSRQILASTTANLVSSSMEFSRASTSTVNLPSSFFLDTDILEFAGQFMDPFAVLVPPSRLQVQGDLYVNAVDKLRMHVKSENGATRVEGDTHFCFLVPERAFEDTEVVKQLIEREILSPEFVVSLMMVDFPNPVRSLRRTSLIKHFSPTAINLEKEFVDSIQSVPIVAGSAEEEFLSYWSDSDLLERARLELKQYFEGLQQTVSTEAGIELLIRFAELRKAQFRLRLLNEFQSTLSVLGVVESESISIDKTGVIIAEQ